ncbi:MAG: hypothetical protein GC189_03780 [Alphaproteobacteria bacterium]|nr:hypothetical protein [Alphaproteobacteria bacterium]
MVSAPRAAFAFAAATLALAAISAVAQTPAPAPVVRVEKSISLGEAFPENPAAAGYVFRARQIELPPGARTEMINHAGRPAITYVTRGAVREHRVGAAPIAHAVGAATFDRGVVQHFWENAGSEPATLLIVETVPVGTP